MKKIIFLTGTRADYGKIKSVIQILINSKKYKIYIFVTGMHLLNKYGKTYIQVLKDFKSKVKIFLSKNQFKNENQDIILSKTINNFSKYVDKIKPDLIVVHGDRLEALAGSAVGTLKQYLVAHIEGGEISGTVDEHMRHAISKLSHIHFVANSSAKKILTNMGESKKSVFVVGSPDLDLMSSNKTPNISIVKERYNIQFKDYAVAILHPNTLNLKHLPKEVKVFSKNAKLILNPTSGAPGFSVENVYCLPGVPSILKSMLGGLTNDIVGGDPILSKTISLKTVESEIASSLTKVQNDNKDVEIGSYPFFHAGKLGVSIVLRSSKKDRIENCASQILSFVSEKKIQIVTRD